MPGVASAFGPVDPRVDRARWETESRALMALLAERLTHGEPPLTVEDFRTIRFEDVP